MTSINTPAVIRDSGLDPAGATFPGEVSEPALSSLRYLTLIITLERFAFGATLGMLAIFLIAPHERAGLAWPQASAILVTGTAGSLFQMVVLVGGLALDRWPSHARRIGLIGVSSSVLGLMMLSALGGLVLIFKSSLDNIVMWLMLIPALLLVAIGNGLFKPTITLAVAGCSETRGQSRDAAFTSFWLGIQIGVLTAGVIPGAVGTYINWSAAFAVAASPPLVAALLWRKARISIATPANDPVRGHGMAGVPVIVAVCLFFAIYSAGLGQLFGLFPVLIETRGDRDFFGFLVPTPWITAMETVIIVLVVPFVAALWRRLHHMGREPNSLAKFALGMLLAAGAFVLVGVADSSPRIPLFMALSIMLVLGMSEIPLQPIGLSLVSRLSPSHLRGRLIGLWFVGATMGLFTSGLIGAYAAQAGAQGISAGLAIICCLSAVVLLIMSRRYSELLHTA
jgi:POT family proton-dependent oligopeptide transporter